MVQRFRLWQIVAFMALLMLLKGISMPLIGWAFSAAGLVDIYKSLRLNVVVGRSMAGRSRHLAALGTSVMTAPWYGDLACPDRFPSMKPQTVLIHPKHDGLSQ